MEGVGAIEEREYLPAGDKVSGGESHCVAYRGEKGGLVGQAILKLSDE